MVCRFVANNELLNQRSNIKIATKNCINYSFIAIQPLNSTNVYGCQKINDIFALIKIF